MKNKTNQQPAKSESPLLGRGTGEAISIIDKHLADGLLYIDPTRPLVIISAELHLAVMDNEAKAARWPWRWLIRHGWVQRDVRYRRLMKAVLLYLELPRGVAQSRHEERLIAMGMDRAEARREAAIKHPVHSGPLHFIVAAPATDVQPLTEATPLLLGTYYNDRIALVEAPSTPPEGELADIADDDGLV